FAGSDRTAFDGNYAQPHFNPRSLCRERRLARGGGSQYRDFNPRSLCRERQQKCTRLGLHFCITFLLLMFFLNRFAF
ncbi:MAG: hypothetical protein RSF73_08910, partial [Ruthenibacterium sp.]